MNDDKDFNSIFQAFEDQVGLLSKDCSIVRSAGHSVSSEGRFLLLDQHTGNHLARIARRLKLLEVLKDHLCQRLGEIDG